MEKVLQNIDEKKLLELSGDKGLIVFFYPKAGTSGCSLETIEYNKHLNEFNALGYNVVGVSVDSVADNEMFSTEGNLQYPLISDPEKTLIDNFKVWGEKTKFGMQGWGVVRSTFVLDKQGKILWEGRDVNPKDHITEIYEFLKK